MIKVAMALVLMSTTAHAFGHRYDINRFGGQITITKRMLYYDDGMRWSPDPDGAPANLCDQKGVKGFEVITGPRKGCYPSQY